MDKADLVKLLVELLQEIGYIVSVRVTKDKIVVTMNKK